MRVALISDVHGRLDMLERALADVAERRPDEIWCLGDITDALGARDDAQQAACVALVSARCTRVLSGNHDFWNVRDGKLDDVSRQQLERWPASMQVGELLAVHGSPDDPLSGFISSDDSAWDAISFPGAFTSVVHGHTHDRALWVMRDGEMMPWRCPLDEPVDLTPFDSWVINPGALADDVPSWCLLDAFRSTAIWHSM